MDRHERVAYTLGIATARDDARTYNALLDATRREVSDAQRAIEDLTIDACTQRVRMKELTLDEELVKKSEDDAILEKLRAQTRLAELGGTESAVRALQKALDHARRDLDATREETQFVKDEERKMQQELVKLQSLLRQSRTNSVKLQEEYSTVMRDKRERDAQLQQLCLFLQPATTDPEAPPSPKGVVHLGDGVQVAVPQVHF